MAASFSSISGARAPVDGSRLVINAHVARPSIDAKLWDAKRNKKYSKLSLTGALGVHGYQRQEPLNIDRDLARAIGELLHCDDRSWERIEFQHCTGQVDTIVAMALARGKIQSIYFSEVLLEEPIMYAFSTGLKFNMSLTEIRFRRCSMLETLAIIGEGLRCNTTIQSLAIDKCSLVDDQLGDLILALNNCSSLQKLSLEGNRCRSQGMTAISSLLEMKHLLNLSLHNQHIEDGEVLDISPLAASMLDSNNILKFLDLSRNSLRDDDIVDLVEALVENRTLETLHLDQNLITDRGAKMIAHWLPAMQTLTTLALPGNPFGEEGALALESAMNDNFEIETVLIASGLNDIQKRIRWFGNLNRGGRRLFKSPRPATLALYPLALERVNNLRRAHDWNPSSTPADVIYGLLRLGPIAIEQNKQEVAASPAENPLTASIDEGAS
jgi:hypothetical protein